MQTKKATAAASLLVFPYQLPVVSSPIQLFVRWNKIIISYFVSYARDVVDADGNVSYGSKLLSNVRDTYIDD